MDGIPVTWFPSQQSSPALTAGRRVAARAIVVVAGSVAVSLLLGCTPQPTLTMSEGTPVGMIICPGVIDTTSGISRLLPSRPGVIVSIVAREGQAVREGDPLIELDPTDALAAIRHAETAMEEAAALHHIAGRSFARSRTVAALRPRACVTRRTKGNLSALATVTASTETAVIRARAAVDMAQSAFDDARRGLAACTLRAPVAGVVVRIDAHVGEIIGPQSRRVIVLCPDEPRVVRAEADQEFAERITPGQEVTILDDSGVTESWRGRVRSVAAWYAEPRLTTDELGRPPSLSTLECVIDFDPGQTLPRLGRRVRASIKAGTP